MSGASLAIAQAPSAPGRLHDNVEQAVALIADSARAGADFVVLPELFLSGYDIGGIRSDPGHHVMSVDDAHCRRLQHACDEHDIVAIVGAAVAVEEGVANAALVFARDGTLLHVYRKVRLWGDEAEAFVPGKRPTILAFPDLRIGMSICFDAGFPEHMRALALADADVIVCPAAFAIGEERRRYELYYPTRALENTVYVAVANAVGKQGGLELFGDSLLLGPRGNEIRRIRSEVGIEITRIDRGEIMRARQDLPYLSRLSQPSEPPHLIEGI